MAHGMRETEDKPLYLVSLKRNKTFFRGISSLFYHSALIFTLLISAAILVLSLFLALWGMHYFEYCDQSGGSFFRNFAARHMRCH